MHKKFLFVLSFFLLIAVGLGANPASASTSSPGITEPESVTNTDSPAYKSIYAKYDSMGGAAVLGAPDGDAFDLIRRNSGDHTRVGAALALKGGSQIHWAPDVGAVWLRPDIKSEYFDNGALFFGPGLISADEIVAANGRGKKVAFQNGAIYWSEPTGAHWVPGEIASVYRTIGNSSGPLGLPITPYRAFSDGGFHQIFEKGEIWYANGRAKVNYGKVDPKTL